MRFDRDGGIVRALTLLCNLFLMQMLWLCFSLPIVTMGAATTALYDVVRRLRRGDDPSIAKTFVRAFRRNFRQSTPVWLLTLVLGVILAFDFFYFYADAAQGRLVPLFLIGIVSVSYVVVGIYVFPMIAWFENGTLRQLANAWKVGCGSPLLTLGILLVHAGTAYLGWRFLLPLLAAVGVSFDAYVTSILLEKAFRKHLPTGSAFDPPEDAEAD